MDTQLQMLAERVSETESQFDPSEQRSQATSPLTRAQGMALLKRLAEDDVFRALYAADPASALVSMGVESRTVAMLEDKCRAPRQLAEKSVFAALLKDAESQITRVAMAMEIPKLAIR
jgi:putative modified peptide